MTTIFEGITIDPPTALDLDDAISVERDEHGWIARIAFPRLIELVLPGEPADVAARGSLFTSYHSGGHARHMLPIDVVRQATLKRGQDRPVFLTTIVLDRSFRPTSVTCEPAMFRSIGQLAYDAASELVRTGTGPIGRMLQMARDLAFGLFERRRASGAIAFYDLERGIAYDEEGAVILMTGNGHVAEMIVREFMVLANSSLAAWAHAEGVPILYRNHVQKSAMTREQVFDILRDLATNADIEVGGRRRAMAKAKTGSAAEGHYALNLPAYAWFTSPLRRYADLVNQRMIWARLEGLPYPHDLASLQDIAQAVNDKQSGDAAGKNAAMKVRHERKAGLRIAQGRLSGADAGEFADVVRAASADPGMLNESLEKESLKRIAAGALGSKEVTRLLLLGGRLAAGVIARLKEHPNEAMAVLGYGASALGWSDPEFHDEIAGPDNDRVFASVCVLRIGEAEHASPRVVRLNKKAARQSAAVQVLAAVADAPQTPAPDVVDPQEAVESSGRDLNHKGRLLEWCSARRVPPPTFEVVTSGPSHEPVFEAVAKVAVDGTMVVGAPGKARTRKEAEHRAARSLIERLGKARTAGGGKTTVSGAPGMGGRPDAPAVDVAARTTLTNLCARNKWAQPTFDTRTGGPGHSPWFTCAAVLQIGGRTLRSGTSRASSKKEAERLAAADLLAVIGSGPALQGA